MSLSLHAFGIILRHLDHHHEESVERVGRVLPTAAVLQRLAAVDFVGANYAIGVQDGFLRHNSHAVPHFHEEANIVRL